ncbi:uncharacterized protein LOC120675425 [Panicum virgatum]|uniref:uncharacterized protein LOC120675425 n=1 Tax=Panicum virgatum TaxID=38727 RepID=UPI0019D62C94|nr:uncharacterized protein LOC120675425 [Panicum virgatum]
MEAERGPPKKRLKKAASCATETSIIVAAPASGMVFPHNETVDKTTHKKRKRKASSSARVTKGKGSTSTTSTSTTNTRSATGSNDPVPIQMVHTTHHFHEDIGSQM